MLIGINYPWINCGWDFGDPPAAWIARENLSAWREEKRRQIEKDFQHFASQGIFAIRWFLLADGVNYGTGESAPQKTGKDWTFEPLPPGHSFYCRLQDDFEFVLSVCSKHGLRLFPSLIDFSWCQQGMPIADNPEIIKGGRYDIVRDMRKRQGFFERILDPLLDSSMRYTDSIYAWELINEPEWVVRRLWKRNANRNVTHSEMKEFIADGNRRIAAKRLAEGERAFQTSVGFAHWESFDRWDAKQLGITLRQFHYYAQRNCALPGGLHTMEHPCVLGEFATASGRDWPELKAQNKDQTLTNRLSCIESKGYPACFLWSARAMDPATRWTEDEHREIIAYRGLSRSNAIRG